MSQWFTSTSIKQTTSSCSSYFLTGPNRTEIAAQFQRDMSLGLPLKANVRHVFVGGDTAQIVVDWLIDGKGPNGEDVHLGGSASDIVRRGADGFWRYIIDNNQGTAVR